MKIQSLGALFAATLAVACQPPATGGDTIVGDATDTTSLEDTVAPDTAMDDAVETDAVDDVPATTDTGMPNEGTLLTMEVPGDLAVANGMVYFTRDTFVRRIPIGGGTAENFYTATMSGPTGIAADANGVAWTERFASTVQGAVHSCPHSGCPTSPTTYSGGESTNRVAVSPTLVGWTSGSNSTVHVRMRDTGSGGGSYSPANMSQYTPTDVAIDGTDFFWTTAGISVPGGGGTPGTVMHCSVAGGSCAPTVLTADTMIGHPDRIALGPGVVFFLSNTGLYRIGRDGTGLTQLATVTTGTGANTFDLATDGTTLYWAVGLTLSSCNAASCTPTTIAALGPGFTSGLEVDATSIYWGTSTLTRTGGIRVFAR